MSYINNFLSVCVVTAATILSGCASAPRDESASADMADDSAAAVLADREITLFQQAITSLNGSDLEGAASDFAALAASRPGLAGPWLNLAIIDIKRNDLAAAEKNVAKALARNSRMPQAHNLMGFIAVSKGDMKAAADHYREAISLKEDYALAYFNMALLHDIYLHDIPVAVQHYKRYLQLTQNQDKKTAEWVAELERSMVRGAP